MTKFEDEIYCVVLFVIQGFPQIQVYGIRRVL